ncbi:MAG: rod shape-determining protein MreC [Oscillospiraceae bacterium]|nr:rod shape-determining protein MreC [Oscillospiraceae bacterium]
MKALVNRQSIIIASVAVLIAIITFISVNMFGGVGPVTNLGNVITRPIRTLTATITGTFERIYASIYRFDDLLADYERVLAVNAELLRDIREVEELAAENALLRAALDFRDRHPGHQSEIATFLNWGGSNWSSSFTINRGYANSNISSGNAVTTEYGVLIGRVSEVGATTSTVITVLDTTFTAGAFVGEGTATIRGDFNLMRSGLVMLDHIDDDQIVRVGDTIVTSGRGEVFPRDLIVGNVVGLHMHPTGIGRYATVRPERVFDAITEVFVITYFEPLEE